MATTCQNVIDRAKTFSPLNVSLTTDPVEMVVRVQQMQQRVFTAIAPLNAARFSVVATPNSTSASSNRTVDLSPLSPPVERVRRVALPSGVDVDQVTEMDPNAELAPRYFPRGQKLYEVGSDWGATGVVVMTILYAYGATPITATGGTSQAISLPDEWADVLIIPLARYLHTKDPGRDPIEYQNLTTQYGEAWTAFLGYVTNYDGELMRSKLLPAPPENAQAA